MAWQVASCHSSAIGRLLLLCCDGRPFFQQTLERQAKRLPAANYVNAAGILCDRGGEGGGGLSMISSCQWVQHNYILLFGGHWRAPPDAISSPSVYLVSQWWGQRSVQKCYLNAQKQHAAASQTYGNSMLLVFELEWAHHAYVTNLGPQIQMGLRWGLSCPWPSLKQLETWQAGVAQWDPVEAAWKHCLLVMTGITDLWLCICHANGKIFGCQLC